MSRRGGEGRVLALIASLAILLPAGGWAAVTVDPEPAMTVVAGGRAGATSFGDAAFLDEEAPPPAPATTLAVAPVATSSTVARATSTTTVPATSTTKAPAPKSSRPITTAPVEELPAFMKTMPNPPGYLPAASSWEAKSDGVSVRMRLEPASPVAGQPVRIHLEYTAGDACCIVELRFGDDSPKFMANDDPPCVKGGTLSPGTHTTVVTHTYDTPRPYWAYLTLLDGDLCTLPPVPVPGAPDLLHHLEMFACIAVGPGTPLTPGCDPLPPYGPYFPQ